MAEVKGYHCDGLCGSSTVLKKSYQSVTENNWFSMFSPLGSYQFCSIECLVRWATLHEDVQKAIH